MSVIVKTDKFRPRRSYAKKSRGRVRFSVGVEKSSGLFDLRGFVPMFRPTTSIQIIIYGIVHLRPPPGFIRDNVRLCWHYDNDMYEST